MNEAKIKAIAEVLAAYRQTKVSAAQVVSRIGSLQRSARRGKNPTESQLSHLEAAFNKSSADQNRAELLLTAYANTYLE